MPDPSAEADAPLRRSLAPTTAAAGLARTATVEWLRRRQWAGGVVDDAALIVSELISNAAEASVDDAVTLEVDADDETVRITVVNSAMDTAVPDHRDWGPEHALARRGRGLLIVDSVAESVEVRVSGTNVAVTAVLRR